MVQFSVILAAAGTGSRFGSNKLLADLDGSPVIEWAIRAFIEREDVSEVLIATSERDAIEAALRDSEIILNPKLSWCSGGSTRAETVRTAAENARSDWLAIHDAARPLVSQMLIDHVFQSTLENGAAAPATPVTLTIKEAGPLPGKIVRTIPRRSLYAMQTPQCMERKLLLNAFASCPIPLDQVTDDLQLLELINHPATLVAGEERNLKITQPIDLRIAHEWLKA